MTWKRRSENDFYERVYQVVIEIPVGRVTSYGAIAEYLGRRGSARLVGYAMMAAHGLDIPCHRVVNRNGELTGQHHFSPPQLMRELLEAEEVEFSGDAVNMKKHFWDPFELEKR